MLKHFQGFIKILSGNQKSGIELSLNAQLWNLILSGIWRACCPEFSKGLKFHPTRHDPLNFTLVKINEGAFLAKHPSISLLWSSARTNSQWNDQHDRGDSAKNNGFKTFLKSLSHFQKNIFRIFFGWFNEINIVV